MSSELENIPEYLKDKEYLKKRLEMAVRNCLRFYIGNRYLWVNVRDILGVGSEHAKALCRYYNLDPDMEPYRDTRKIFKEMYEEIEYENTD